MRGLIVAMLVVGMGIGGVTGHFLAVYGSQVILKRKGYRNLDAVPPAAVSFLAADRAKARSVLNAYEHIAVTDKNGAVVAVIAADDRHICYGEARLIPDAVFYEVPGKDGAVVYARPGKGAGDDEKRA